MWRHLRPWWWWWGGALAVALAIALAVALAIALAVTLVLALALVLLPVRFGVVVAAGPEGEGQRGERGDGGDRQWSPPPPGGSGAHDASCIRAWGSGCSGALDTSGDSPATASSLSTVTTYTPAQLTEASALAIPTFSAR